MLAARLASMAQEDRLGHVDGISNGEVMAAHLLPGDEALREQIIAWHDDAGALVLCSCWV